MVLVKNQLIIAMTILIFLAPAARGADIEDVHFVDTVELGDSQLSLRGTGLFRYMGLIKAYVGALYMLDGTPSENVLADTPKRLEIEYFYPIKGEDFGIASIKVMAQNVGPEEFESLKPRLEKLNALYRDVQPGDRYALNYVPGKGTELILNGNPLGLIAGADFASALYAMWLGEKPMNKSFKRQLLESS
ncbi:MAG: chalcone isomerase family protein [Desulfobacterales bacterium]|nr:chalcone isomerase family protein [Desulfobacterales bacterium]MDX2513513.1 chalcone isomerase family protein [Desulfobacterales bacterium]